MNYHRNTKFCQPEMSPTTPQPLYAGQRVMVPMQQEVQFLGTSHQNRKQRRSKSRTKTAENQPPPQRTARDERWSMMYDMLSEYKSYHGHCHISEHCEIHPGLAVWVKMQRRILPATPPTGRCKVFESRIELLHRLGFAWTEQDAQWCVQFDELRRFKQEHGHLNIGFKKSSGLGAWLETQMYQYQMLLDGKPTVMTRERGNCLQALGLKWKSPLVLTTIKRKPADRTDAFGILARLLGSDARHDIAFRLDSSRSVHFSNLRHVHLDLLQKGKLPHLTREQMVRLVNRMPESRSSNKPSKKIRVT